MINFVKYWFLVPDFLLLDSRQNFPDKNATFRFQKYYIKSFIFRIQICIFNTVEPPNSHIFVRPKRMWLFGYVWLFGVWLFEGSSVKKRHFRYSLNFLNWRQNFFKVLSRKIQLWKPKLRAGWFSRPGVNMHFIVSVSDRR